ncbi:hypothetical protein AB1Y20_013051 [Prymnesium parvum]|uniref:Conserved oligomeric Golgi complex subunit 7 n=1 Tax=Prymnesium parvum TaxID=97485 RepID=A0AB34IJI8_PRYPA
MADALPEPSPTFSAPAWVNAALLPDASETPLDMRLSVLLTRLQLGAADADEHIRDATLSLARLAPPLARELSTLRQQAAAVRAELAALMLDAAALAAAASARVEGMGRTIDARRRLAAVGQTLAAAEEVAATLRGAEAACEARDDAAAAAHLRRLASSLGALGEEGEALFPGAAARVEELRAAVLRRLQPALVRAVTERDAEAMESHVRACDALGVPQTPRQVYVESRQGPLYERWSLARQQGERAAAVRGFCDFVVEHVRSEQARLEGVGRASLRERQLSAALAAHRGAHVAARAGARMEEMVLSLLPTRGGDGGAADGEAAAAGAEALASLEAVVRHAAARAAAVGELLGEHGAPPTHELLLAPFDAALERYPSVLGATLRPQLPAMPRGVAQLSPDSIQVVDAASEKLFQLLKPAVQRCLACCGPLAAPATVELVSTLFAAHVDALLSLVPPRPRLDAEAEPMPGAYLALLVTASSGGGDIARQALLLLRAAHGLRAELSSFERAFTAMLQAEASTALDSAGAPRSAAQRAAAASLRAHPPSLGAAYARMGEALHRCQEAALASLMAGVCRALREVSAGALQPTWARGAADGAAAALAFSPSPLAYITQVGEELLGLPQRLEPFVAGASLTLLSPRLRGGGGAAEGADEADGATEWLLAIGEATACLLLRQVERIGTLTPLGARQLAADASYLSNILSAGLGLPPSAPLAELEALLTAPPSELAAVLEGVQTLPARVARAIVSKRQGGVEGGGETSRAQPGQHE